MRFIILFLVDTDVISESRKGSKANNNVRAFFGEAAKQGHALYISVITVGELRRGVELLGYRNDHSQARRLESWLEKLLENFVDQILDFGPEDAQVWGRLRVPHPENAIDKQIAATALTYDLTLVTGNIRHFESVGVRLFNPFALQS